jgi:SAM-dependent methyltransferase
MRDSAVSFTSEDSFEFDGLKYFMSTTDYTQKTTDEQIVILKPKEWIDFYQSILQKESVKSVLEVSVFQGGMAFLLPSMKLDLRYMGVDLVDELPAVTGILARRPDIGGRVRIQYGMSQDDPGLPAIAKAHFGGGPLDMIIDDASHMYGLSRRTFEQLFPLLRPGGCYIVEDWAWAHWRNWTPPASWLKEPSLSNLLFKISIATASDPDLIASVETYRSMFVVRRGSQTLAPDWKLNHSLHFNGQKYRPLVSPPSLIDPESFWAITESASAVSKSLLGRLRTLFGMSAS